MNYSRLEEIIDYKFKDIELLKKAMTHISYANENAVESNERLEFLGDAVLELIVSEYLFEKHYNLSEGEMTKVRATVVCEKSLYIVAKKHNFSDFLFLGKSEVATKGNERPSLLADFVEAIIGAIYLDGGIEDSKKFAMNSLKNIIEESVLSAGSKDYKTLLQEELQKDGDILIEYKIVNEEGPAHDKVFTTELRVNNKVYSTGIGKNKKEAETEAAKKALEKGNL